MLSIALFSVSNSQPNPLSHIVARATDDSGTCPDTRTAERILYSCLSTILASTYIGLHPNIPAPNETMIQKYGRKLAMFGFALLFPELITGLALHQMIAAIRIRRNVRKNLDMKLSMRQAFYILMGGYMLATEDWTPIRSLTYDELKELAQNRSIHFTTISNEEIADRNKSDSLAKFIVIVQMAWFIAQFGGRIQENLPPTQLEVVTVAYAVLNVWSYIFWWHKPKNIVMATRVPLRKRLSDDHMYDDGESVPWPVSLQLLLPFHTYSLIQGSEYNDPNLQNHQILIKRKRLPTFYGGVIRMVDAIIITVVLLCFGAMSGLIAQLVGKTIPFPSNAENHAWYSGSGLLILFGAGLSGPMLLPVVRQRREFGGCDGIVAVSMLLVFCSFCLIAFVLSKVLLFYLSFSILFRSTPAQLQNLNWADLIPHI